MGTVLRILREHNVGGDTVMLHPTWRPDSHKASALLTLEAIRTILLMPRSAVAHVHLSEKGSFVREGSLLLLARSTGRPAAATIHGASFLSFARQWPRLTSRVLGGAHLITCLDPEVRDVVRQYAPRATVELLPNPVPMDTGSPCADETDEVVVFAGEISLRKGADVLHQAWQEVADARPHARCVMVGPPKDFQVPTSRRLELRPSVDSAAMRDLLRSARVVALPSRAEGMPMLLTEAMSAGRPFVSTPVGGIPDLAREGGVLVPVGDSSGLASRLIDLLADPQLARSLGEQARQFCLDTRSVEVIDKRLRTLYGDVLQSAGHA